MRNHVLRAFLLISVACSTAGSAQEPKASDQKDQPVALSVAEMKRQILSCKPHEISRGLLPKGTVVPIRVTIDTKGKVIGLTPAEPRCPVGCGLLAKPIISIKKCKFSPLTMDGQTVAYSGNVELIAP
jgi:hypothetical protein